MIHMGAISDFVATFSCDYDKYLEVEKEVKTICEDALRGIQFLWQSRVKAVESLEKKLNDRNGSYKDELDNVADIVDLVGGRIILADSRDLGRVGEVIKDRFHLRCQVQHPKPGQKSLQSQSRFRGYDGYHYQVTRKIDKYHGSFDPVIEIQVMTAFMWAYATVAHDIEYKQLQGQPTDGLAMALENLKGISNLGEIGLDMFNMQILNETMISSQQRNLAMNLPSAIQVVETRITNEQPLATQYTSLKEPTDHRLKVKANEEATLHFRHQFTESLAYPEIFARGESIVRAHDGTCRWIFGPPREGDDEQSMPKSSSASLRSQDDEEAQCASEIQSSSADSSDSDQLEEDNAQSKSTSFNASLQFQNEEAGNGNDTQSIPADSSDRDLSEVEVHLIELPWSNFKHWLMGEGKDPYWLSGKPGSGKSTLMKYISTEFSTFCRSDEELSAWSDAVICSHFFWNLGTSMQKDYAGLLRSLLFQIAEQKPDMIAVMNDPYNRTEPSDRLLHGPPTIHTWTEHRLESALRRVIDTKPPLMRVCMFIDGLDEYEGDEDRLIDIINLISHSSGTKICASSRPEEIFRQGFAESPKLRLQDLNYPDIYKATVEQLSPVLEAHVPALEKVRKYLIDGVVAKSQGIFLWAHLMTKELKRGARNADTIGELERRLERVPETIDGLYEHMLSRLDKAYLRDASRYFQHLLAIQGYELQPTVLDFACVEESVPNFQAFMDPVMLQASITVQVCQRVETRILSRCAGLVEIDEHAMEDAPHLMRFPPLNHGGHEKINLPNQGLAYFIRKVRFIHRSASEFLRCHTNFFEEPNWQIEGALRAVCAQIAYAKLLPSILSEHSSKNQGPTILTASFLYDSLKASKPDDGCRQVTREVSDRIVDETYKLIGYLCTALNDINCGVSSAYAGYTDGSYAKSIDHLHPFYNPLGFATYFGRQDYVARKLANSTYPPQDIEYILHCAIIAVDEIVLFRRELGVIDILLDHLPRSKGSTIMISNGASSENITQVSKWAEFARRYFRNFLYVGDIQRGINPRFSDLIETFFTLDSNADPNIIITYNVRLELKDIFLNLAFQDTILAILESFLSRNLGVIVEIAENVMRILKDYGGTSRRRILSATYRRTDDHRETGREIWFTDEQSYRLQSVFPLSSPVFFLSESEFGLLTAPRSEPVVAEEIVLRIEEWARSSGD